MSILNARATIKGETKRYTPKQINKQTKQTNTIPIRQNHQ